MVNDKGGLWLTVNFEDFTGQTTVNMNEKKALALSGRKDKDAFLQAVNDGDPVFPTVLSAKIVRKLKTLTQEESTDGQRGKPS